MKHGPRTPAPRAAAEPSETTFGLRAGLAVTLRRPGDVRHVAYAPAVAREVASMIRWAASLRVPCKEVAEADLERMAGTRHHEGLCVVARPRAWAAPARLADALVASKGVAVALDRVRNPYNVGAILRTMAFFGADAALLGAPAPHPALAPDAVRVAEGGAEHLLLCRTTDLAETLARLASCGVRVVGADAAADTSAIGYRFERPSVLVVGHEREGLHPRVRERCDAVVAIRGKGAIESLNVAVATAVLIAEMVRGRT
jgi:TrmH RNA methyltransferase